MSKRFLTIVISLLFCLGLLSGCTEDKPAVSTLRLGTHTWMGYEPLPLARSLGHLDEQVKLVEFASARNVIRAFKKGSIEAPTLTLEEARGLKHSGLDLAIILVNDFSAGGDAILLRPALASGESAPLAQALQSLIAAKPDRHALSTTAAAHIPFAMSNIGG